MTNNQNAKFLTWGVAGITEVAIVAAFIGGWFSLTPTWGLIFLAVFGCIITTLVVAMIVLAGGTLDKGIEGRLKAIAVPAITLCLLSAVILLSAEFHI